MGDVCLYPCIASVRDHSRKLTHMKHQHSCSVSASTRELARLMQRTGEGVVGAPEHRLLRGRQAGRPLVLADGRRIQAPLRRGLPAQAPAQVHQSYSLTGCLLHTGTYTWIIIIFTSDKEQAFQAHSLHSTS